MKEGPVQDAIQRWLHRFPVPVRVRKLSDRYTRGLPDLQAFYVHRGVLVLLEVEVKRPKGGKLSALQVAESDAMRKATAQAFYGVYVHVVAKGVADVRQALEAANVGFAETDLLPLRRT